MVSLQEPSLTDKGNNENLLMEVLAILTVANISIMNQQSFMFVQKQTLGKQWTVMDCHLSVDVDACIVAVKEENGTIFNIIGSVFMFGCSKMDSE